MSECIFSASSHKCCYLNMWNIRFKPGTQIFVLAFIFLFRDAFSLDSCRNRTAEGLRGNKRPLACCKSALLVSAVATGTEHLCPGVSSRRAEETRELWPLGPLGPTKTVFKLFSLILTSRLFIINHVFVVFFWWISPDDQLLVSDVTENVGSTNTLPSSFQSVYSEEKPHFWSPWITDQ